MHIQQIKFRKKPIIFIIVLVITSILPIIINNINLTGHNFESTNLVEGELDKIHTAATSSDFKYYKEITIDHTKVGTGVHSNFPLLINITDQDLHDDVQVDGDDIAFYNGTDWLDYEIESFIQDYSGTHAHLVAWVRIPTLSNSADTTIYMYYGNSTMESQQNPSYVWNSNYKAVWHLNTTMLDSTSNNNDGTNYGANDVSPFIGHSREYNGAASSGDYSNMGSGSSIDNVFNGGATISAWIYPEGWGGGQYGRVLAKSSITAGTDGWVMCVDGEADLVDHHMLFYHGFDKNPYRGLWYTPADSVSLNQWQYLVVTYDASSDTNVPSIYINGIAQSPLTPEPTPSGSPVDDSSEAVYIGNYGGAAKDRTFDGVIDEVRISSGIKTSGWIQTEYNNQYNPNSFYSLSSEIVIDNIPPEISINAPIDNNLFGSLAPNFNVEINDNINIDTRWYRLLNGTVTTTNTTFTTNETISQLRWEEMGNGTVTIQFFANDSAGNIGFSEVTVRKDIYFPTIIINSPIDFELFGSTAPDFNLETWDINGVDDMWYTLNNSIKTYFTTNGTISSSIWNTCGNGTVSIKFYANDSLGNQGFSEVIVRKEISAPTIVINSPSSYDLFGSTAPDFNVEIWDENSVDDMWYTLNNGIEEYFTVNGTILQSLWSSCGNGTVSIKFYANNSLGNGAFSEVIVRKDIIDPILTINAPDPYDLIGRVAPSFNVIITDPNGIDTKWYTIDGGITNTTFTANGIINQALWEARGNGTVTIRFYANDSLGNEGYSEVIVRKDIESPSIQINSPNPYEVFGAIAPSFNVRIVDSSGINLRWYTIDGGATNITFTSNGTINQPLWSLEGNGTVTIQFYGRDSLGNEGFSEVIVRKDIEPPSILINSPIDNELFNEVAPTFNVEIWDINVIDTMWYTLNNGIDIPFTGNGTISQSAWDICGNGTVSIKFYANDSLGNQNFSEVIVRKEISAPIIQINSPSSYDLFGNTAPSFNVEIWDSNGIDTMWYTLNNGIKEFFSVNGTILQSLWNTCGNGTVLIKFYANNSLGNGGSSEVIVRKDVISPVITINNPDDYDRYRNQAPSYNVIITDPNGIETKWYTLDGGITNTTFISDGIINQTRWDEMGNGTIVIRFYARDSIGNEGFSDVTVYKDIIAPTILINSPGTYDLFGINAPSFNVEIIDGSGINLRWYTIDNGLTNITFTSNGTINQGLWSLQGNGTVTIKFFATDSLDNEGFSEVIVRKDIDPPSVVINNPILNQIFGGSPPSFNVEITDNNGIDTMWYSLDGGFTKIIFATNESINPAIWNTFGDGNITLQFYANNSIGSIGYSEVIVRKDMYAPSITINTPNNNTYWNHAPIINIYSYDISFDNLWIRVGSNNISITNNVNFQLNSSIWNSLPQGFFQIFIYTNDTLGHLNTTMLSLYKDTISPSAPILLISPTGEVSVPLIFDWEDGTDASGIAYYRLIIDNEADPFSTPGYVFEVNITNLGSASSYYELTEYLSPRNYYFFIYSVDGAGNQGIAVSGSFIISGSSGTPTEFPWWIILIIAIPLGLAIAIVALRKSKKVKVVVVDKEVELLKEQKKQLEMKARSALKAGNYQNAAELYSQCRHISNQLIENGIEEEKDKFRNFDKIEKDLQLKLAAIPLSHTCINNMMTSYFDQLGVKYYSNPDIYPETQGNISGLILNNLKFLENRLTNPTNGEILINDLGLQPDQTSQINGIQFVYTNDLSEESLIKLCSLYQNPQMLLLIVGVQWPSFEYDQIMAVPRDASINYRDNIRIINNDLLFRFTGIEGKYRDIYNEITETNFDYNELEALLKNIQTDLHDTEELKEDLKKMGWYFFL